MVSKEVKRGHPTVIPLIQNCFCLKELQGWKCRDMRVIEGPTTGLKWDTIEEEVPRTDTVAKCSQKGT